MNKIESMIDSMKESGTRVPLRLRIFYWMAKKLCLSSGVSKPVFDEEIDNKIKAKINKMR